MNREFKKGDRVYEIGHEELIGNGLTHQLISYIGVITDKGGTSAQVTYNNDVSHNGRRGLVVSKVWWITKSLLRLAPNLKNTGNKF